MLGPSIIISGGGMAKAFRAEGFLPGEVLIATPGGCRFLPGFKNKKIADSVDYINMMCELNQLLYLLPAEGPILFLVLG
jgi:hypothetical protein